MYSFILCVGIAIISHISAQTIDRSAASSSASALSYNLSSECVTFISQNPPTVSQYASQICQLCQNLQLSPSVESCCSNSNPTACFASSFYGITVADATRSAPITVAPPSLGSVACDAAISIFESCEAASPGFDNLCFHDQQSCLCSTSNTWAPSYYDNYWSECLGWVSTADPAEYSILGPNTNGVVQSRKCQTWAALTASGGTPSNCLTASSNILTSTLLVSTGTSSVQRTSSTGTSSVQRTSSTGMSSIQTASSAGGAILYMNLEREAFAMVVMLHVITLYVVA